MKGPVVVLGRRTGQPVLHRQWVDFNVDFRIAPTDVISAVNDALQAEPIPGVAAEPRAHCILFDFKESYCHYVVRYWLADLASDDPTDSLIRTRIYFALKRHAIPLSIPAQSLFVTEDSEVHRGLHLQKQVGHRLAALAGVELFHTLNEDERHVLAGRLHPAPFAKGEAMTRQGTEAHSLYILTKGSAEVDISVAGAPRRQSVKDSMLRPGGDTCNMPRAIFLHVSPPSLAFSAMKVYGILPIEEHHALDSYTVCHACFFQHHTRLPAVSVINGR